MVKKIKIKWLSSKYPGVRFWEHPDRKHGVNPDKYFAIRYYVDGKRLEEGLGWASQGWTAKKAADERGTLLKAQTTGEGARTLQERREIAEQERAEAQAAKEQDKRDNISFKHFFEETYYPISLTSKKQETYRKENEHVKNWILPVVGNLSFKKISPFHLEKIKKNLLDAGRAPRTVQYCFAVFRHIWNTAKNHDVVTTDSPTKKVKVPSFSNERQRFLTQAEAEAVLQAVREKSEQLYQMSKIALHCGLRASEIFNLTWGDVFIDDGYLVLKDTC
ncbi:MAG: site-specific integrase [Desulfosalsimonadaceae bacterium]